MFQGVTIVVESKQFTWNLLDFFNHCLYQCGNGKRLVCISLLDFPLPKRIFNSIWVIVDRLTKSAHFIQVRTDYGPNDYAKLYFNQIVRLHGVPRTIVSDRGPQFTVFWEHLHKMLGTNLVRSSAYHPQTSK